MILCFRTSAGCHPCFLGYRQGSETTCVPEGGPRDSITVAYLHSTCRALGTCPIAGVRVVFNPLVSSIVTVYKAGRRAAE